MQCYLFNFSAVRKTSSSPAALMLRAPDPPSQPRLAPRALGGDDRKRGDAHVADLVEPLDLAHAHLVGRLRVEHPAEVRAPPDDPPGRVLDADAVLLERRRLDDGAVDLAPHLKRLPLELLDAVDELVDVVLLALDDDDARVPARRELDSAFVEATQRERERDEDAPWFRKAIQRQLGAPRDDVLALARREEVVRPEERRLEAMRSSCERIEGTSATEP